MVDPALGLLKAWYTTLAYLKVCPFIEAILGTEHLLHAFGHMRSEYVNPITWSKLSLSENFKM